MRGGQNIKSVAEKKALGTSRKVRDIDRLESAVTPVDEIPMPAHFSGDLAKKWVWVCDRLKEHRVLTIADRDIVQVYCENWAIYEEATRNVLENGGTLWVHTAHGKKPITNPAFRQMKDAETTLRQIWEHFGFSPRARMGLKVTGTPKTDKPDPFAELLKLASNGNA